MQQPTAMAPHGMASVPPDSDEQPKQLVGSAHGQQNAPEGMPPGPHLHGMNDVIPPHQVYVGSSIVPPAMAELETQFQSLQVAGFKPQDESIGTDQLTTSAQNSDSNNIDEAENEGEESEEEPVKLFVGQVSRKGLNVLCHASPLIENLICIRYQKQ